MSFRPPARGADLLMGAIDLHVHTAPCLFQRPYDDAETAALAKEAGMRGVVVKDHHSPTALRAYYARKIVPGIEVFGGLALNSYQGGLNPYIVESELKYGAKVVWMPTVTVENHIRVMGGQRLPDTTRLSRYWSRGSPFWTGRETSSRCSIPSWN